MCVCARSAFAGQLAFGEIRIPSTLAPAATSGARAAARQLLGPGFEKMKLPLLLTVCNGDLPLLEVYQGEMKGDPLRRHISGYSGSSSLADLQESCTCFVGGDEREPAEQACTPVQRPTSFSLSAVLGSCSSAWRS